MMLAENPPAPRIRVVPDLIERGGVEPAARRGDRGRQPALPAWARVTAATLPRTTATLLELDDLHRTKSPLDPKVRAMARWVVADANRCQQSQAVAVADLKRAGATDAEVGALKGDRSVLSAETRRVLDVARELTRAAYKVSDDQMALLKRDLGESKLVALRPAGRVRQLPGSVAVEPRRPGRGAAAAERRPVQATVGRRRGQVSPAVPGARQWPAGESRRPRLAVDRLHGPQAVDGGAEGAGAACLRARVSRT